MAINHGMFIRVTKLPGTSTATHHSTDYDLYIEGKRIIGLALTAESANR